MSDGGTKDWIDKCLPWAGAAALAAAITITVSSATPTKLPSVALSSAALFHIERTVAVLATLTVAITLVAWTLKGRLPSKIGAGGTSVEYPDQVKSVAKASDEFAQTVTARLGTMELAIQSQATAVQAHRDAIESIGQALDKFQDRIVILGEATGVIEDDQRGTTDAPQ